MKVIDLLVLFGHMPLAVKLCEGVYERVAKAESLWSNPEERLAKVIFCDELQKKFMQLKTGGPLDWNDFDRIVRPYGYNFNEFDYQRFEQVFLGKIDPVEIGKQFKKNFSFSLWDIQLAFCCYMWNEKKIPFGTSEAVATLVLNYLAKQVRSPNCGVDKFFKFKEANLEKHVVAVIGVILPCMENGFALVWGVPSIYTFLNSIKLIDNNILLSVIKIADSLKNKLISGFPDYRKIYHFCDALEQ